ncbi:LL-diaminopimelate aminotransferase [Candidatus Hakubella thermalkaliphila]|uniref:Aminotransferase n=3 Tax=Candidatus Hakubella thermalkaliphila TaxID=2754717 RepID=A0A6V8P477_9ACTN|nr:LL-diaminopimelate aminotransferase [Candidatus Hakubella thermalkaliphila]GFP27083.1 LL-diaminopimelate aminotransferase [Candidatus Hakubella thermalkaliphila]
MAVSHSDYRKEQITSMRPAKRIENLPPYMFTRIDQLLEKKQQEGADIINLGIGDPDRPTPEHIVEALCQAAHDPANQRYPSYYGLKRLRDTISLWFEKRFGVALHPDREILPTIGSKEGLAHVSWALINEGDWALLPNPAYTVYKTSVILAGGRPYDLPLLEENDFLVDFDSVDARTARRARLLYFNYPNNPTSAVADGAFFERAIQFAKDYDLVLCHDCAYSEITFDGYKAPSLLQFRAGKDVGIEFHSLSKTFNMTGWRIGFAVGNSELIDSLATLKTNIDSGVFNAIQHAAIEALEGPKEPTEQTCLIYQNRRDLVIETMEQIGLKAQKPQGTMFVWARVPPGFTSESFSQKLVREANVFVTPGSAFGSFGEGFIRISLTISDERLKEAMERIRLCLSAGK